MLFDFTGLMMTVVKPMACNQNHTSQHGKNGLKQKPNPKVTEHPADQNQKKT